ncbi:MAG: response regulator [Candidatus Hodarchaeota archaeon]
MKPLIMIVEDNKAIIENMKLMLELNEYEVITAEDGISALHLLKREEKIPHVIVSDIMMPNMDGLDFFETLAKDGRLKSIPFIIVSALSTPKDIRTAKMLGVDDYLTKPYNDKDLLASIQGKINRYYKNQEVSAKIKEKLEHVEATRPATNQLPNFVLLFTQWDDKVGPELISQFPREDQFSYSTEDISAQLFSATTTIYGQERFNRAEGILINIDNIKETGYIYFDFYEDTEMRSGEVQYMFAIIAPSISYLQSLKLKKICAKMSKIVKLDKIIELEGYWNEVSKVLSSGGV